LADFWPEVPAERRGEPVIVRSAVAPTFVAALELCRQATVRLDQREHFGAITVSPYAPGAAEINAVAA
jgi:chromatin segregation and condensation protein Rec8/ScpA/Scc1 (kleisin family)